MGVIIHKGQKLSLQCVKAAKKAKQVLRQMAGVLHYRARATWITLYMAYQRCHLEYCIQAWSPWIVADRNVLETVQMKAVKMVSQLEGKDYKGRLEEVGFTALEERWKQGHRI